MSDQEAFDLVRRLLREAPPAPGRTGQVVIVDDDVHWRRFLGRLFRAPRWSVMPFSDPENALVYVQARGAEFDLVDKGISQDELFLAIAAALGLG